MPAGKNDIMPPAQAMASWSLIEGPAAWTGAEIRKREAEWTYGLSSAEIAELETAVKTAQARGLDIADIRRDDFPLPTLGPALERLRVEVLDGRGFVLLRGMPVEEWPIADSATAYWGIGSYFGSARSQNAQGHLPAMSATWGRASARRTRICAAMQPLNARIIISTAAMWSHCYVCGGRSREGFRQSSAR